MGILSKRGSGNTVKETVYTQFFAYSYSVEGAGGGNTAKEAGYKINVSLPVSKWGGGGGVLVDIKLWW